MHMLNDMITLACSNPHTFFPPALAQLNAAISSKHFINIRIYLENLKPAGSST
jgi:hypothetical protein